MKMITLIGCGAVVGLVGCSGLPSAGPTTTEVFNQAQKNGQVRFSLVEVDNGVVDALAKRRVVGPSSVFARYKKPPSPTIGVGDSLSVSIWQSTGVGTGLLGGAINSTSATTQEKTGGGTVVIPEQVVGADGAISVPYAGRARAAGQTPFQVQQTIEHLLAEHALQPQVIVTVAKSVSGMATVSGDVASGGRIPLSVRGERLLDVIAAAGGPKFPLYETFVRLSRRGTTVSISMDKLVSNPHENIYVWPDDIITLVRIPQTFLAFGATLNNTQVPFGASQITLAQAIAKAGGLLDARADPTGVFLFRFEPQSFAQTLKAATPAPATADGTSRVLYHVNLQDVDGYFLASRFPVQNDDIIYIANASTGQTQKFMTLIGSFTQPIFSGVVVVKTIQ
jgi:polysaccharide biosynthesis/export protein